MTRYGLAMFTLYGLARDLRRTDLRISLGTDMSLILRRTDLISTWYGLARYGLAPTAYGSASLEHLTTYGSARRTDLQMLPGTDLMY